MTETQHKLSIWETGSYERHSPTVQLRFIQHCFAKWKSTALFNSPRELTSVGTRERETGSVKTTPYTTTGSQTVDRTVLRTVLIKVKGILTAPGPGYTRLLSFNGRWRKRHVLTSDTRSIFLELSKSAQSSRWQQMTCTPRKSSSRDFGDVG